MDWSALDRPTDLPAEPAPPPRYEPYSPIDPVVRRPPPPGFTGRSSVLPLEVPEDGHFIPAEDRWRVAMPEWDRYDKGHPRQDDYPYDIGRVLNPYTQNVLKGDYPILGQHTFLELTATSFNLLEPRLLPTATTPFESTRHSQQEEFFGKPNQFLSQHTLLVSRSHQQIQVVHWAQPRLSIV